MSAISLINPYTESPFGDVATTSLEAQNAMLDAARAAHRDWRHTDVAERMAAF